MDVAAAPKLKPDDGGRAPAADAAIEINGLSLRFETADGPVQALSNVTLRIARGEFVSFIGPSGCGKTTLLRAVADLETPTSGSIRVNSMSPREARANRAYGYVFQAPALYPWRSVARNIALPLEIMGFDRKEREARVAKGLELVNLSGFGAKYPWQLSGGMQQRASIARALSFDPDLLLMDEPFGALDEIVRDMLNQHAATLGRDGQARAWARPCGPACTRWPLTNQPCIQVTQQTDVSTLPQDALSLIPDGILAKLAALFVSLFTPATPWRADVAEQSDGSIVVSILRNGVAADAVVIRASTLWLPDRSASNAGTASTADDTSPAAGGWSAGSGPPNSAPLPTGRWSCAPRLLPSSCDAVEALLPPEGPVRRAGLAQRRDW